jgi:hypothetical protein
MVFIAWGACPNVVAMLAEKWDRPGRSRFDCLDFDAEYGYGLGSSPSLK